MDLLDYLIAALLGLVEGLTEFIPVSSTGHLILVGDLLGFEGPQGDVFEVVIQFGAILAVIWLYRAKFLHVAVSLSREPASRRFVTISLLGFLPALVIGAFAARLHQVGAVLALGGVASC